jgi:2-oxo-4-hydroxy-4-carboxy-5-ureidoimidazoline decarboxylase
MARLSLAAVNVLPHGEFAERLGGAFEHSPWIAEAAAARAPFASVGDLHETMLAILASAPEEQQLALLGAHPELAAPGTLTAESASEQRSAGLGALAAGDAAALAARNAEYRARFGFPFIIAVRGVKDTAAILRAIETRLAHSREEEIAEALRQAGQIARFRLDDLVAEGRVTTHVLDTATGRPAARLALTLDRIADGERNTRGRFVTNTDGRCDTPLLAPADMAEGEYEIVFEIGQWRKANDLDPGFYDRIPIRFRITDTGAHYHVPLILAPYGYATYRGS